MPTDLLWRSLVPLAAAGALLAGVPHAVAGSLALLGLTLAAERLAALRRSGVADRLLVVTGGLLVVLVLTGPVLDAIGVGLSPVTWTVAAIVLAVAGLVLAFVVPPRTTPAPATASGGTRATLRALPWVAAAVLVTVVAVRLSAASLSAADAPPLQMSLDEVSENSVQVVVSSSDPVGPLELRTTAGDNEVSYPLFDLAEDGTSTTTLSVPSSGRYVITLNYPDQTEPLRTLVLDR